MAVDYRPVMGEYTELKPFRFWCQKVLPLVYDDSLSYYELLCKVVDYLNKTMEDVDVLHGDVDNLSEAYEQLQNHVNETFAELQEFINDYFDNLDVQQEIDNKLDAMAQDGSLSVLLAPFIPDLVSDWLDEHITPTTPAIDNTLTVSGAGADAKVTGDKINNINSFIPERSSPILKSAWNGASGEIVNDVFVAEYTSGNKPSIICYIPLPLNKDLWFDDLTSVTITADITSDGNILNAFNASVGIWRDNTANGSMSPASVTGGEHNTYDNITGKFTSDITKGMKELPIADNWTSKYYAIYIQPNFNGYSKIEISNIYIEKHFKYQRELNDSTEYIEYSVPSIPRSIAKNALASWTGTAPTFNNIYLPLTIKKNTYIIGLNFITNFTSACVLTVAIKNKERTETIISKQITISESGENSIKVFIPTLLTAGEYALTFISSEGTFLYPVTSNYIDNDFLATYGTVYVYNNPSISYIGEIYYLNDWEEAFNDEISNGNYTIELSNVNADNPNIANYATFSSNNASVHLDGTDIIVNYNAASGNAWFTYAIYKDLMASNFVIIDFDITIVSGAVIVWFMGKKTNGADIYGNQGIISASGHYSIAVDLNYYTVYYDLDNTKPYLFGIGNSGTVESTVSNFKLLTEKYKLDNSIPLYENINNIYEKTESNTNAIINMSSDKYLTAPNGRKYELAVSNDGTLHAIPTIPDHTLFIGNSLLTGNGGFGMCASDSTKDYFYLVKTKILEYNSNATFSKLSGTGFEGCTSVSSAESWMNNTLRPVLNNTLNLVIVQLGDNVNTSAKLETFRTTCKELLEYIKEYAPNARVAWAGEWYSSTDKQNIIANACAETSSIFIDITYAHTPNSSSYIGAVIRYDESATRSYNIDSYTDNSATHELAITFTRDGVAYNCTVPYTSYTYSDHVISITGYYGFVTQSGVASHPGDIGFENISNLMTTALGL